MSTLNTLLETKITDGLFPGAVVAAGDLQGNRILKAFGHAQVHPQPVHMQPDTLFDIESVTKAAATATALSILVDEGSLQLEQPVNRYLPHLRGTRTEDIQVRHLVTHTSGYKWGRIVGAAETTERVAIPTFFQKALVHDTDFVPGKRYCYSNRNAILAGLIVESVTGMRFGLFCKERVFEPLGLCNTLFGPLPRPGNVAANRSDVPGKAANEDVIHAGRAIGTAGLFSTAPDLDRLCRFWLRRGELKGVRLFSEETWAIATANLSPVDDHPVGIFWQLSTTHSPDRPSTMSARAFGHSGHTGQSIWIDPTLGVYTIVMTNRGHPKYSKASSERGQRQIHARSEIADAMIRHFSAMQSAAGGNMPSTRADGSNHGAAL